MNENIFEIASRRKLRFETTKGNLSVEDLWDLPLTHPSRTNLDDIAKELHQQANSTTVSFVVKGKVDETAALKFNIVKHIIDVRLAEGAAAEVARINAEKKAQIRAILHQKQNEALASSSVEELEALLKSL